MPIIDYGGICMGTSPNNNIWKTEINQDKEKTKSDHILVDVAYQSLQQTHYFFKHQLHFFLYSERDISTNAKKIIKQSVKADLILLQVSDEGKCQN